jgi:S-ribosylhomocysteine lyase LuxS involved in autoinducer biosynthesis
VERGKQQVETTCEISDLLRGKIMFDSIDDLAKAVDACDKLCHLRGYEIL